MRTIIKSSTLTRPSDTTAYAAGDAITNSTSAPTSTSMVNCADGDGAGIIVSATLIDSANVATAAALEVWIFNAAITLDNDNAAFTPTDAELATLQCIIPMNVSYVGDATSGAGGNRMYIGEQINKSFLCTDTARTLYWALVVRNAYVPVSAEAFTLNLSILHNGN
jgi:hypothetical protein